MWRCDRFLIILLLMALASCNPFFQESDHIEAAFKQAQLIYSEGENDTLLFIPELDKTSAYYVRKKDFKKAAQAALYYGYAEKDYDKTTATCAFKDAEHYSVLASDSLTMARAEYQLGRLLYYDGLNEEALNMFRKSDSCFGNHYDDKVLLSNAEACSFLFFKQYDEADSCFRRGLRLAELGVSNKTKNKLLNNYSVLYLQKGEYDKAIECLRKVLPTDNQQVFLNQLNLGNAFMAMGNFDSAAYYFQLMKDSLPLVEIKKETKVAAYASFTWLAECQGDYESALHYNKLYGNLQNVVQEDRRQNIVYRIQKKYDYESIENELKFEKIQKLKILLVFVSLMLVAVIMIVFMVFRHKQMVSQKQELENELNKVKHDLLMSSDISKTEEILLRHLQLILKANRIKKGNQSTETKQKLMERYIYREAETLFDAALAAINMFYPKLLLTLQLKYPNLNETEMKVCMLSIKGLSNTDIADIIGVSVYTVNKSRSSLYKKMEIETDAFKTHLMELKTFK